MFPEPPALPPLFMLRWEHHPSGSYRRDSTHFFAGTCFLPRLADWGLLRPREEGRQAAGRWENWGSLRSPSVVISLTWWWQQVPARTSWRLWIV